MMRKLPLIAATALVLSACATTGYAPMPGALPPSDIAGIVMTVHEGEIEQGQAAAQKATNAQVREFAQMMVTDHTNGNNTARDVFGREGISPGENDTTRTLTANSRRTISNLNTYSGAAFDREYMRTQVAMHEWTLNSLDNLLIPSSTSAAVRSMLETQRASVAAHLEHARRILGSL